MDAPAYASEAELLPQVPPSSCLLSRGKGDEGKRMAGEDAPASRRARSTSLDTPAGNAAQHRPYYVLFLLVSLSPLAPVANCGAVCSTRRPGISEGFG
eukprot:357005-Chlamydomonas_euryale.AAC.5